MRPPLEGTEHDDPGSRRPSSSLLQGELGQETVACVRDILRASTPLSATSTAPAYELTSLGPSLSHGSAGIGLLHAYAGLAFESSDHWDDALACADHAIAQLAEVALSPGLFGGFAGIGWSLAHLVHLGADVVADEDFSEIDEALLTCVQDEAQHFDLVRGLVGYGCYALERLPSDRASAMLEHIVGRLAIMSQSDGDGTRWRTDAAMLPSDQRQRYPNGVHDLGMAHGVAGVLAFLSRVHAAGIEPTTTRRLVEGAVDWLLSQALTERTLGWFGTRTGEANASRLAWCYGDPGIATALLVAARALGRGDWEATAIEIGTAAATRTSHTGVNDAGLCHGAAGLGHLFHRLFRETGVELFADAARAWFASALETRRLGTGVAGFSRPDVVRIGERVDDCGLLEGTAGIGLALLAAVSDQEPGWDRALLISTHGS